MARFRRLIDFPLFSGNEYWMLPQNLLDSPGTLLEDFESTTGFTVSGTGASMALDAVNFKTGSKSIQLTTGVGVLGRLIRSGISWPLADWGADFELWFYFADVTTITGSIEIQAATDGAFTKRLGYFCYTHKGWNHLVLRQADWTLVGGMTWSDTVTTIRFIMTGAAGQAGVVSFDSLRVNTVRRPAIVVTFDDSDSSIYASGYSYMKRFHLNGTVYPITGQVGDVNKVTWAQLQGMSAEGWTVGNHTRDHATLSGVAEADQETAINNGVADLTSNGLAVHAGHVAYPGGSYDENTMVAMTNLGMLTGRTIDTARYPYLPQDENYRIQLGKQFGNTLTLAQAKAWVDGLVTNKQVGIALFHVLVAGAPATASEWKISDFQEFIDYAVSKHLPFLTIDDFYDLASRGLRVSKP